MQESVDRDLMPRSFEEATAFELPRPSKRDKTTKDGTIFASTTTNMGITRRSSVIGACLGLLFMEIRPAAIKRGPEEDRRRADEYSFTSVAS